MLGVEKYSFSGFFRCDKLVKIRDFTSVSTDTEVSIHPQKTSVNLKPVKTLLKKFRLFPNMVAFLTVANIVQMFELHASKQFSPPYAMERNSGLFRFCGFNVASRTVANR